MRAALYQHHKHDLGCPTTDECVIFKALNQSVTCGPDNGCSNWVTCVQAQPEVMALKRIGFLVRIDAMVNVGCKFAPDDLSYETWDELIVLVQERNRIERLLREQQAADRDKSKATPDERQKIEEARREGNVPAPGQSIFK